MLKIFHSRNLSLLETLCLYDFPLARRFYRKIDLHAYDFFMDALETSNDTYSTPVYHSTSEHLKHLGITFLRSFQPLPDLLNGFIKTFRPYKSGKYVLYDLAQPIRGIGNVLYGALSLVLSPFLLLLSIARSSFYLIRNAIQGNENPSAKLIALGYMNTIFNSISFVIQNALTLAQGVIQLITTPLVIPKMLMRGLISACVDPTKMENSRGVRRLLKQVDTEYVFTHTKEDGKKVPAVSDAYEKIKRELVNRQLKYKYKKSEKQWREVPEIPDNFHQYDGDTFTGIDYIGFFGKYNDVTPDPTPAEVLRIPSASQAR